MNSVKFILFFFLGSFFYGQGIVVHDIDVVGNNLISDDNIKFISGLEEGMYVNNFKIQKLQI